MKSTIKSYSDSLLLLRKIWLVFLLTLLGSSLGFLFGLLKIAPKIFPRLAWQDQFCEIFDGFSIGKVKRHGRKVDICGQAPRDYPKFAANSLKSPVYG